MCFFLGLCRAAGGLGSRAASGVLNTSHDLMKICGGGVKVIVLKVDD